MIKKVFFLLLIINVLFLCSCKTVVNEIYNVTYEGTISLEEFEELTEAVIKKTEDSVIAITNYKKNFGSFTNSGSGSAVVYKTIIEYNNIKPIIIFTKRDLLNAEEYSKLKKYIDYYKKIGYEVYMNTEIKKIKKTFLGCISVFTGQTGAGKSTLLNKLDKNLNLKTGEISLALNRGKHTTRYTELLELFGGMVAAVIIGTLLVPAFYAIIQKIREDSSKKKCHNEDKGEAK